MSDGTASLSVGPPPGLALRRRVLLPGLAVLALVAALLGAGSGGVAIAPGQVVDWLLGRLGLAAPLEGQAAVVLEAIRLPRLLLGLMVGAALGLAGAVLQGLFRNPLADPGLVGVSSGAALAAIASIVVGEALLGAVAGPMLLPVAAFAGGLAVTLLVYRLARREGHIDVATMLLAGIAINALAFAGIGMFTYISNDLQLRQLTFWSMGSLGGAAPGAYWPAILLMAAACAVMLRLARPLNLFLLGEAEARHLGVEVETMKRWAIVAVALAVGAAVAVSGLIGFVGLVVPHLIRLMVGPDHRLVLAGSALLGAALLTVADTMARTVVLPAELPIGIVTSAIGGPFFLWLLVREQRRWRI